jgi:Tol biopolymer transport system component
MRTIRAALASGTLAFLAACGGGDATTPDAPPSPSGTATLGAAGGTLASDDGVSLTVPPGSLSEAITLRVARDTTGLSAALQGGTPQPDKAVAMSPIYSMTPHGTVFAQPVELRVPLDAAAAGGPGLLVVLHTEPGRDGWDVLPVQKIENGKAVVNISSFSFYRVVRITGIVLYPGQLQPVPPVLEMSMTLGGASPSEFMWVRADGTLQKDTPQRRLYGSIGNRIDSLRLSGRVVGLPATCSTISLAGRVMPTQNATAADTSSNAWGIGRNNLGEPVFAQADAAVGSDATGGVTRPTLTFAFDINIDNAPFKVELFRALRASNTTGPTPPIGLNFNAYVQCNSDVDLGGGMVVHNWMVIPGAEPYNEDGWSQPVTYLNAHNWLWNTVLFTTDYLPQGVATPPQDVTVAAGMPASFTTSVWSAPEGESRIEWWRSDNGGVTWSRVRTTIVPITLTADTFTLPAVALSDNNSLVRVRHCGIPRTATPDEGCTDSAPARLTVLQGVSAASFSLQPRPVLVRTGQTATFSVAISGSPTPSVRWQRRAANSSGAWADVGSGGGAATLNYTTTPLTAPDNGLQLRAVATNSVGEVASVAVTVSVSDIDVPPTIASQPAALSVVLGSEAVFAVVARGTEALSYQWRRNGAAINGANAPLLKLAQVTSADATGYSVLVSNTAGSVVSETASLTVSDGPVQPIAPSIVTQPVAVVVNAGNTATFAVGVSGSGSMSYQWLHNGTPIAGATAAFHSMAQVAGGDAGAYAVRVSNGAGLVTSAAATLTVNAGAAGSAPAISTQPATLVVAPGGSATLAVAASGSGPLAYQWLHDGAVLVGQTAAVYHVTSVSALDAGAYQVRVSNALGEVTSAAAQLLVVGAPAVTLQPASVSVAAGSSATFSVAASGDALRYQWLRDSVAIAGATGASYTTPAVLGDNGARFSALVYNSAGLLFSQVATLTVTASVPPALSTTTLASVRLGSTAAANNRSILPTLSNDGNLVAFISDGTDLVAGTTVFGHAYVRNLATGTTTLINARPDGGESTRGVGSLKLAAGGRYAVFTSFANDLVAGDTNNVEDVFLRDLQTGITTRLNVLADGSQDVASGNGSGRQIDISADGQWVLMSSIVDQAGDGSILPDGPALFLRHIQTGSVRGLRGFTGYGAAALSASGDYIAIVNATGSGNESLNRLWVHDVEANSTSNVLNVNASNFPDGIYGPPSISDNGRYIAFGLRSSTLLGGAASANPQAVVLDTAQPDPTLALALQSISTAEVVGDGPSTYPKLSRDGRYVLFLTSAPNLAGDPAAAIRSYLMLRDRHLQTTVVASRRVNGSNVWVANYGHALSGDGALLACVAGMADMVGPGTPGEYQVFAAPRP